MDSWVLPGRTPTDVASSPACSGGVGLPDHKHADAVGIPRFSAVICLALDASAESTRAEDGRLIIPFVEWPSIDQAPRPWADVVAEFGEVLMPIFDAPITVGEEMLDSLGERYQFKRHQF